MNALTAEQELYVRRIVRRNLGYWAGALGTLATVAVVFLPSYLEGVSKSAFERTAEALAERVDEQAGRVDRLERARRQPAVAGLPVGSLVLYAGQPAKLPPGWMYSNGRSLSRDGHGALFDVLGTAHGNGGSGQRFNVPDARGRFFRAVDHSAGQDPDRTFRQPAQAGGNEGDAVGSIQLGSLRRHGHAAVSLSSHKEFPGSRGANTRPVHVGTTTRIKPFGGQETRPTNIAVNVIIRVE